MAQRALLGAWQRVLPEFFPQMADDTVEGEAGGGSHAQTALATASPAPLPPHLAGPPRVSEITAGLPSHTQTPLPSPLCPDVVNIRSTRVVLVTDRHVAYLRARHQRHHSMYKAKWLLPIAEIQNLSGGQAAAAV